MPRRNSPPPRPRQRRGSPNGYFLTELRERLGTLPGNDLITNAFDRLVERKRLRYANDDRAVGNWELRLKHDGSTSLWAEARGTRR